MKSLKLLSLFIILTTLSGCLDSTTNEPEIITEYSSRSNFYIVNQTELDLTVTYEIAFLEMDSTVAVPANSATKIFEAGDIGSSPSPSSALDKLSFFDLSNNSSAILIIQPIIDADWIVSGEEEATRFELMITNDDLD